MKWEDLMEKLGLTKKRPGKDVMESTSTKIEQLDIPKVIFENLELQVAIGQWLGILPSHQSIGNRSLTLNMPISAEELIQQTKVTSESLNGVVTKFGELLKMMGVDSSETCFLSQYNRGDFSFTCGFSNAKDSAVLSIRYGDMVDDAPNIRIKYHDSIRTYYYNRAYKEYPMSLELGNYKLINSENDNILEKSLYPYTSYNILRNKNYTFTINVGKPKEEEDSQVYRLKNEKELEEYLLGLSFPFDIVEVYKKMCELSLSPASQYPTLSLNVEKAINEKTTVSTDVIVMENGKLTKFIITRDGRKISIDNKNNWSLETPEISISQDNKGNVDYRLHSLSMKVLERMMSPTDQVMDAQTEVEEIRKLSKTLL